MPEAHHEIPALERLVELLSREDMFVNETQH